MSAIFHLTCPSCGAQVPVHSPTSVLVVCEYCQSTLLRDGEGVRDSGRKSTILEDYSPLQIHTSGVWQGLAFEIIGRIQMRYDRGFWNEWYVMFANGTCGWLADSGWQYVMTKLSMPLPDKMDFFELTPGASRLNYQKQIYIAADVRTAQFVSANAQGELPFAIKHDWESRAADFRSGKHFLTLDYSDDHQQPVVYAGHSVTLKDLHCQLLRSREQIIETAGKLRGQVTPFSCPNCGSSLTWYPGVAQNILCPSCHSDINMGAGQAQLIATHRMRVNQRNAASIDLGAQAKIGGVTWAVIGMIRMQELDAYGDVYNQKTDTSSSGGNTLFNSIGKTLTSANKVNVYGYGKEAVKEDSDFQPIYQDPLFQSSEWYEYLLYNPEHGFRWIVESEEGWDLTRLVDEWPAMDKNGDPVLLNKSFKKGYDYGSKVLYAAGAFYWHVLPGDVTYISDYVHKNETLSAERNRYELAWSRARRVSGEEIATWFKRPELAKKRSKKSESGVWGFRRTATVCSVLMLLCNLPFLFTIGLGEIIEPLFWGLAFIWTPLFWTDNA